MANPPADLFSKESRMDRLRRELRNPSMVTVILIAVAVFAIPGAILLPGWINTAQKGFQERSDAETRRDEAMLSITELVPAQIAPWMATQINRMLVADSPYEWSRVSFTDGACFPGNLSQLPEGKYSDAIVQACHEMASVQAQYAHECPNIANCNFSDESGAALIAVRTKLFDAFADSGFVLPPATEQSAGP